MQVSLYQQHVKRWSDCQECGLCEGRSRVVLAKGKVPADIVFCGEAPGFSEDSLGRPFEGPAGSLLESIVEQAMDVLYTTPENRGWDSYRIAYTNLNACLPTDEDGRKAGQPSAEEIVACGDRLREFVGLANPKLIVAVGDLPDKWLPKLLPDFKGKFAHIKHPSAVLRLPRLQQTFDIKRCVIVLRNAVKEVFG